MTDKEPNLIRAEVLTPHGKVVVLFPEHLTDDDVLRVVAELAMGMREANRAARPAAAKLWKPDGMQQ